MTMHFSRKWHRLGISFACVALLYCGLANAQDQSMDCSSAPAKTHVTLAKDDQNAPNLLKVARKLPMGVPVDLEVCDADLTIKGSKDELLRITVEVGDHTPGFLPGDYLQTLDVNSQAAIVKLHLPKHPSSKVIIEVPSGAPSLKLNLVRGDLSFQAERVRGERKINVVSGRVELLSNRDTYSILNLNVLIGSYHDHRPGGEQAHGIVSKSLSGVGRGSIDLNVVRGSVDVRAWD